MRGAWGTLVTLGAFGVMIVVAASMVSDDVDSPGTFMSDPGGEVNMAMATVGRMRSLIGHLRIR
jgi:hypothetical protein